MQKSKLSNPCKSKITKKNLYLHGIIAVRLQLLYSLPLNSFHKSSHHERTSFTIKEIKANEPKETVIK